MRVLLVHPAKVGALGLQDMTSVEPLALELLAACLPGHEVRILDLRKDADLGRALEGFRPQALGITCTFTTEVYEAQRIARLTKQHDPGCFVFVGGHHATLSPHDFQIPAVDVIVCGEGERTVAELVACLEAQGELARVPGLLINRDERQESTGPRPFIANLDDVPDPRRDLTAEHRHDYYWGFWRPGALVETARGCPYRCSFCSVWRFHDRRVRVASAPRVVAQLRQVQEEHVFFTDDNFLLSLGRAQALAHLLKREGIRKSYAIQSRSDSIARWPELMALWRDVGLESVFLGLEKADAAGLQDLNKRNTVENNERALDILERLGIAYTGNFIADPDYGHEDFGGLREYVTGRGLFNASFTVLTPLPGTELYDRERARLTTGNWELFDLWHTVLPTRLDLPEFYREFAQLWAAAAACRPKRQALGRALRLAGKVVSGRLPWRHIRMVREAGRALRDPEVYLRAHRDDARQRDRVAPPEKAATL